MRVEVKGISETLLNREPHYRIQLGPILEVRNVSGKVIEGYPGLSQILTSNNCPKPALN